MTKKKATIKYIEQHKASGLKVGDKVKVLKSCKSYEKGWGNTWAEDMNSYVGKICTIFKDSGESGFKLERDNGEYGYCFPYFVLEKVEEKKAKKSGFHVLDDADLTQLTGKVACECESNINNQYPAVIRLNGEFFGPFQNKEELFTWLNMNTDAQDEKNGLFFFTLSNPSRINLSWEFKDISMEDIFKSKA